MGNLEVSQNYEDNPDFNQSVDEQHEDQYGVLSILGVTLQPSRVIFEMDPVVYRQAAIEYKQQTIEDFKVFICDNFPSPIAYHFHRFEHGYDNDNQRLQILRDVWESLIRLLFAMAVGEFTCSDYSKSGTNINRSELFSDKLHDKLNVIKKLIQLAYGEGYQLSFLSIVDIDIVSKLEELNRVRNLFSHISALSEDQARQMVSINLDNVLSLLKQLENLSEVVIMRYIGQTQPYKIKVERFKGYAINRDIREIEIKQEQMFTHGQYLNDRSILIILSDNIFSVSPFLHFTREGHNTKLCFYTKREGTGPNRRFMYEIFDESRRVEIDEANFSHELSRLDLVLPDTGNSVRGQGTRGRQI